MNRFSNIVLVAGATAEPDAAPHYALQLTRSNHAALTVVGVVEEAFGQSATQNPFGEVIGLAATSEERRQWLENRVSAYGTSADQDSIDYLKGQLHLVKGKATRIVPDLAEDLTADLVIMGTLGRSRIPGYLISDTAESILTRLDCSVLTVKPPGFVSPIAAPA